MTAGTKQVAVSGQAAGTEHMIGTIIGFVCLLTAVFLENASHTSGFESDSAVTGQKSNSRSSRFSVLVGIIATILSPKHNRFDKQIRIKIKAPFPTAC